MNNRRRLATFHKWLGLSIAAFVAMQCTSGLLLVYRADLQAASVAANDPMRRGTERVGDAQAVERILAKINDDRPNAGISRVDFPKRPGYPFLVYLRSSNDSAGEELLAATITDGDIDLVAGGMGRFLQLTFNLHHTLFAGDVGRYVVAAVGISLLTMTVTGLIVWWPGSSRFIAALRVSRGRMPAVFYWQLHRTVGVLVLPIVAVTLTTGTLLAFSPELRSAFVKTSALPPPQTVEPVFCRPGTVVERIAAAQRAFPGRAVRDIRFTEGSADLGRVLFVNRTRVGVGAPHQVWLHVCSARIARTLDANANPSVAGSVMGWLYPLHAGIAFGRPGQTMAVLGGSFITAVLITGMLLWLYRRKARQTSARRRRRNAV